MGTVKRQDALYYVVLIGLMFVLPIGFAWHDISNWVIEFDPPFKDRFLKLWVPRLDAAFVLWAVGVRLVLEGVRRIIGPRSAALVIAGPLTDEALLVVRQLGFACVAIGCPAIFLSYSNPFASECIGLIAGVFYLFSGAAQLLHKRSGRKQDVTMLCELTCGLVLLVFWGILRSVYFM